MVDIVKDTVHKVALDSFKECARLRGIEILAAERVAELKKELEGAEEAYIRNKDAADERWLASLALYEMAGASIITFNGSGHNYILEQLKLPRGRGLKDDPPETRGAWRVVQDISELAKEQYKEKHLT